MHNGKRRIFAILGLALLAMALVFPASVAARPHRTIPADVLGDHVWTGQLCDGTAVSVKYHVTDRGRLVFDEASAAGTRPAAPRLVPRPLQRHADPHGGLRPLGPPRRPPSPRPLVAGQVRSRTRPGR